MPLLGHFLDMGEGLHQHLGVLQDHADKDFEHNDKDSWQENPSVRLMLHYKHLALDVMYRYNDTYRYTCKCSKNSVA